MWDDHVLLERMASWLIAAGALALSYALLLLVVRLPLFAVREVVVTTPALHTTREQVQSLVEGELRGNFFTLDLEQARVAFEKLPWVRRASLRRAWPDRLEVELEEHVALARWRDSGLVNTYGELFEAATDQVLPVFTGPSGASAEMADQYRKFQGALAPLRRSAIEVRLSARRAWQLKLDDGYTLELGRQDAVARVARFAAAYPQASAWLAGGVYRVDLRYPNGFAVRMPARHASDKAA
jgi:cell division protein FtsQ